MLYSQSSKPEAASSEAASAASERAGKAVQSLLQETPRKTPRQRTVSFFQSPHARRASGTYGGVPGSVSPAGLAHAPSCECPAPLRDRVRRCACRLGESARRSYQQLVAQAENAGSASEELDALLLAVEVCDSEPWLHTRLIRLGEQFGVWSPLRV